MTAKTERLRRSFFPQAIRLLTQNRSNNFYKNQFNKLLNIHYYPYCCYVYTRYNLFAHSSCTSLLIILLFIKPTVYCPAHFIILYFLPIFMYILLCCVSYNCTVHWTDLIYISLLIIFHIIMYVTNKILNLLNQSTWACKVTPLMEILQSTVFSD